MSARTGGAGREGERPSAGAAERPQLQAVALLRPELQRATMVLSAHQSCVAIDWQMLRKAWHRNERAATLCTISVTMVQLPELMQSRCKVQIRTPPQAEDCR